MCENIDRLTLTLIVLLLSLFSIKIKFTFFSSLSIFESV